MRVFRRKTALSLVVIVAAMGLSAPVSADMKDVVSLLLKVCLAGGTSQQIEGEAKGEIALTLAALKKETLVRTERWPANTRRPTGRDCKAG